MSQQIFEFFYNEAEPMRLDIFLAKKLNTLTRAYIKKLNDEGKISVNNLTVKAGYPLKYGDKIAIEVPPNEPIDALPEEIELDIIYEDSDLLVINKPQGIVVHPCNTTKCGTLVNALLYHIKDLSGINGKLRPGIIHRLDKNTSGLIIVAKNDFSHKFLANQLKDKTLNREYLALVKNVIKEPFEVSGYLQRNAKNRKLMSLSSDIKGKYSKTRFEIEKKYADYTLLRCILYTGRTHQIRAHLRNKNIFIVGDKEYGIIDKKFDLNGQLLHAEKITFIHPTTKKVMTFNAPLPDYFVDVLKKVAKQ